MSYQQLSTSEGMRTYVVIADPDDDVLALLDDFARAERLSAAQLTAVGAFSRATVGWFDPVHKEYRKNPLDQQCEVLSLVGDIAVSEGVPAPHLHAVLGLSDGTVRGGHLLGGTVWPTLEVVVHETPSTLRKTFRPEIGLALIDLDHSD